MNLKARLQLQAQQTKAKWETIEQDYLLSWILEGISAIPKLKENLIFKGGTALKKVYFGDYRFSQDIDFSAKNNELLPSEELTTLMEQSCKIATNKIRTLGENIDIKSEPYFEKKPHPEGQKAFSIQARFPWHRNFYTKVYAEISFKELILLPSVKRKIIHPYGEVLTGELYVYPLEEILAEKIRALLQFAKKLHERGWGRSRVRDYYDLWRILKTYSNNLNLKSLPALAEKKCLHKGISFVNIDDIFQEKLLLNLEKEWEPWLLDIVPDLPSETMVIKELKRLLEDIF